MTKASRYRGAERAVFYSEKLLVKRLCDIDEVIEIPLLDALQHGDAVASEYRKTRALALLSPARRESHYLIPLPFSRTRASNSSPHSPPHSTT